MSQIQEKCPGPPSTQEPPLRHRLLAQALPAMYSGSEGRSSNNTSNSTSNGYSTLDDGILRVYQAGGGGREDASQAGNELRFQVIPHLSYDDVT